MLLIHFFLTMLGDYKTSMSRSDCLQNVTSRNTELYFNQLAIACCRKIYQKPSFEKIRWHSFRTANFASLICLYLLWRCRSKFLKTYNQREGKLICKKIILCTERAPAQLLLSTERAPAQLLLCTERARAQQLLFTERAPAQLLLFTERTVAQVPLRMRLSLLSYCWL